MNWTGLAARVWDPSGGNEPQLDHGFIKNMLENNPGPALDVGCGTGRLLIRYLRAGLEVEGIDTSADMLVVNREESWEALRRFYDHLEPDGVLILNIFWPFDDGEPHSEEPLGGFGEWSDLWTHKQPDGSVIAQHLKIEKIDRAEQLLLAKRRYQLIQDGQLVQEEIFNSNERWYYKHEMVLMLEKVGFPNVQVKGDWSEADFAEGHASMVFIARKSIK